MLEASLLNNIQQFICKIQGKHNPCIMILKFLTLKQLKVLHLNVANLELEYKCYPFDHSSTY